MKNIIDDHKSELSDLIQIEKNYGRAKIKAEELLKEYPEDLDLLLTISSLYLDTGETEKSINHLTKTISLNIDNKFTHYFLAQAYIKLGDHENSIKSFLDCINKDNHWAPAYKLMCNYILTANLFKEVTESKGIDNALCHALQNDLLEIKDLVTVSQKVIVERFYLLNDLLKYINKLDKKYETINSEDMDSIFDSISNILNNNLMFLTIGKTCVTNNEFEKILTLIRKILLKIYLGMSSPEDFLKKYRIFLLGLCYQSYHNGGVWVVTEEEKKLLDKLLIFLTKKQTKIKNDLSSAILIFYSYFYHKDDDKIKKLSAKYTKKNNNMIYELVNNKTSLKKSEKKYQSKIRIISEINNTHSLKVSEHYDNYSSQKWRKIKTQEKISIVDYINQDLLPTQILGEKKTIRNPKILSAGSGSGRKVALLSNIEGCEIDCIDISRKNIAYAQRKCDEHKIKNVNFYFLDFLDAKLLDKKYDYIEIIGIIDQLEKPHSAFKLLKEILKPDGYIRVGLRSLIANSRLEEIRISLKNIIADEHFSSKQLNHIRSYINNSDDSKIQKLTNYLEFYEKSSFYRLLEPQYKVSFNIEKIKKILTDNDFKFLGWSDFIKNPTLKKNLFKDYFKEYPDDVLFKNLDNWHKFEINNPVIFSKMYRFWITNA